MEDEPPAAEPAPDVEPAGEPERYGPLLVRRYRKPDGRALTLYELAGEPEAE